MNSWDICPGSSSSRKANNDLTENFIFLMILDRHHLDCHDNHLTGHDDDDDQHDNDDDDDDDDEARVK